MKTFLAFILYTAQAFGQNYTIVSTVPGTAPTSNSVNVSCTFSNRWTAKRHPNSYPTNNSRWSPMILASHNADYTMWATGELASAPVQIVAETGVKLSLLAELENSSNVLDQESGRPLALSNAQSLSLDAFRVDADFPLISSIAKIFPSPDWFSGFTNFSPMDSETNTWYESFEIDTFPFDAGTDSGELYESADAPSDPPENISQKTVDTLQADDVFVSLNGTRVMAVARWNCTVVDVGAPSTMLPSPTVVPSTNGTVATPTAGPSDDNIFADSPSIAPSSADTRSPSAETNTKSPTDLTDKTVKPTAGSPTAGSPTARPSSGTGGGTVGPTMNVILYDVVQTLPSTTASKEAVGYSCSIANSWTATNHPKDYPTGAALWSPMILVTHSTDYQMWGNGMMASPGIKSLTRKSGDPALLLAELAIQEEDGTILDQKTGVVMNLTETNNQTIERARLDAKHPYITTISMIAPSPDWFSGFYNFNAVDSDTDTWYESFIIQTYPWDAGTDSGTTYKANEVATDPPVEIFQLTADTVPKSEVFISLNTPSTTGITVLPVSKWECTKVAAPPPPQNSGTVPASLRFAFVTSLTTTLFVSL